MKLIVGLGNPEAKYSGTRHNIGFEMLDRYAHEQGITFKRSDKFKALVGEFSHRDEKVFVIQPQTYYNLSGEAVRAIADFYKIPPEDILVIHDELALPIGTVRTRVGGSDAGNNGVKSISSHVGHETARIRIGTGSETRETMDDAAFVLAKFSRPEADMLDHITSKIHSCIDSFISGTFEVTTHT